MPTEAEFEEAKVRFFTAADEAEELLAPTRRANDRRPLKGGKLTGDVDGFVDVTGRGLQAQAEELRDLARVCRDRAEECRAAAAALADYNRSMTAYERDLADHRTDSEAFAGDPTLPEPGPAPTRPDRPPTPPPYVEL